MSRIFFAEFRRLFHFRLYYIECAAVVLFSVLYFKPPVIDSFLFYIMIVIGAFSAICVSQFIGMEYSCGTIRNKLATGHTRMEIYLAQLILHIFAAVILFHLSVSTIVIAGQYLTGRIIFLFRHFLLIILRVYVLSFSSLRYQCLWRCKAVQICQV